MKNIDSNTERSLKQVFFWFCSLLLSATINEAISYIFKSFIKFMFDFLADFAKNVLMFSLSKPLFDSFLSLCVTAVTCFFVHKWLNRYYYSNALKHAIHESEELFLYHGIKVLSLVEDFASFGERFLEKIQMIKNLSFGFSKELYKLFEKIETDLKDNYPVTNRFAFTLEHALDIREKYLEEFSEIQKTWASKRLNSRLTRRERTRKVLEKCS